MGLYRIIQYDPFDGALILKKKFLPKIPKTELLFRSLYQINHLFQKYKEIVYLQMKY